MWIMNKVENALIQSDFISEIFLSQDRTVISAKYKGGSTCNLGIYDTQEDAKIALRILSEKLGGYILEMPNENEIKAKITNTTTKKIYDRTSTGKKIKRHGGS